MHHHSPPGSVEDGGWTLATRTKRGCRRSHVFSAAMTSKCHANLDGSSKNAFAEDGPMGENDERGIQAEVEQLTVRMERYKQKVPHKYLNTILCFIKRILCNCPLELIRTFGIGPIGTSKSSVYQLVLLEAIKDHFGVPMVTCQDPVTSLCEKRYLQGRGITVLPADDLLTPPPVDVRSTGFTLLYMFHCSPEMYNNVLSWYLRTHRLQNVILIGNEPNDCLSSSKTFPITDASIPLTNLSIFAFQSVAFRLPKFEPLEFAFESSFISYLDINTDTNEQNNEDFLRKIIV